MIDILPRFADAALQLRLKHIEMGREIMILTPQAIASHRRHPTRRQFTFTEADLDSAKYDAPSIALVEIIVGTVKDWLNIDPLLWCQYGARTKLIKLADTYTISLYPYPP